MVVVLEHRLDALSQQDDGHDLMGKGAMCALKD